MPSPGQPTSATTTTVGTASATWNLTRPTASSGDLVVFVVAWDDSTTTTSVTAPAGPNGETGVSIAGPVASASTEMRVQAWHYIATGAWSGGTSNWTHGGVSETCRAQAFVIPAGTYNASDPIGWSNTNASAGTAESTLNSPTGTAEADDGNGRLFLVYGSDADAITAPASGTTTVNNATGGGVGLCVVSRDALVSNSESVANITASITSDSWATIAFVVKADNSVTLSLTGVEISSATGVIFNHGQQMALQLGTLTPVVEEGAEEALTGSAIASGQGSVTSVVDGVLTGSAATLSTGTLVSSSDTALSGQGIAAALGSAVASISVALTGQSISAATGSVSASTDDSESLTGQSATLSAGTLTGNVSVALTGSAIGSATGTLTADTGVEEDVDTHIAADTGVMVSSVSVALTGVSMASATGDMTETDGSAQEALTGDEIAISTGSISSLITSSVSGQELGISSGTLSPSITRALTGQSISASTGTLTAAGGNVEIALVGIGLSGFAGILSAQGGDVTIDKPFYADYGDAVDFSSSYTPGTRQPGQRLSWRTTYKQSSAVPVNQKKSRY